MKSDKKIAVIGMACRFPGAANIDEYWLNLIEGRETITHFTDEELAIHESDFISLSKNPDFVRARGILTEIDKFDSEFFEMTPREAAETDPQHRIWLQTSWEAFEDAGCDPYNYPGAIGVFAGAYINTYLFNNILRDESRLEKYLGSHSTDSYQIITGNNSAFIPSRTAYQFNLRGPAINVQTGSSTSLVAITQACQSLLNNESDICLAGGVCIVVPQERGYMYQEGSIQSPDGHCRPFDENGMGTVFSNGVGVVVLKRMEDAIKDHDRIYSVISGWAINNDGRKRKSYMAPGVEGQSAAVMMAQVNAGVAPEEIGYIETNGTATLLGDPVELAALLKAFSSGTTEKQFCGIGSVKSNIGHTDAAAGVASFIKASLTVHHRLIPPTLNFSKPGRYVNLTETPFYIQNKLKKWDENRPLIAGVSSFGIGGTNAHVIVEEPPAIEKATPFLPEWPELIVLSARSEYSLKRRKQDLINFVRANPDANLRNIAYTLAIGRNHMPRRSFMVISNTQEINFTAVSANGVVDDRITKIAFMFPGQGSQYVSMGRELYHSNVFIREILDNCFAIMMSETKIDLKSILFEEADVDEAERLLNLPGISQPALFIIEYAIAKALQKLNIIPDYLIGHGLGEITAAALAGVFDMESALKIVIKRGQLLQDLPKREMLTVRTNTKKLEALKSSEFEIAAENSPEICSISFETRNYDVVTRLLSKNDIAYFSLNSSPSLISSSFDLILSEFSRFVNLFNMQPPQIQFISCLTGTFITSTQATSGRYWTEQLRSVVRFSAGISSISAKRDVLFLEVGPNSHLCSFISERDEICDAQALITTLGKTDKISEPVKIITAVGKMYLAGSKIDFLSLMRGVAGYKLSLPVYRFRKVRHWVDTRLTEQFVQSSEDAGHYYSDVPSDSILSGETEAVLLQIWKEITGHEMIRINDNFFKLGGHSLLALQILSRIREELSIKLPLNTFFENPTIEKLANKIDAGESIIGIG
jgi:phthiocerol/phenolphthiocerol synthesis type-I polyketide synthase E